MGGHRRGSGSKLPKQRKTAAGMPPRGAFCRGVLGTALFSQAAFRLTFAPPSCYYLALPGGCFRAHDRSACADVPPWSRKERPP
jgi:hypothetical protein